MGKNPTFELSEKAYENLNALLDKHKEYNCVRFTCGSSCCNKPTVDILLDEINADDLLYKYKNIQFVYSEEFTDRIESIQLIYTNSNFMLKFEPLDKKFITSNKSCHNCTSKNNNCHNCSR